MDKGFIMYYESEDMMNLLSSEQLGDLIKKAFGYFKRGEEPQGLNPLQQAVFLHIKEQMTCTNRSSNAERQRRFRERQKEKAQSQGGTTQCTGEATRTPKLPKQIK